MRALLIWLIIAAVPFGTFGGVYHWYLLQNPRLVLVVVDSSFPMRSVWEQVPTELERIGNRTYARFSLVTEKYRVHGWSSRLELGTLLPYAPRSFAKLRGSTRYPEIKEATEIHFITNAPETLVGTHSGWKICRLE